MFRRFAALEKLPASRSVCIYWKGLSAMVTVVPKKNVQPLYDPLNPLKIFCYFVPIAASLGNTSKTRAFQRDFFLKKRYIY